MHPLILGAGALSLATTGLAALAACPAQQAVVQEVFIAADCARCWSALPPPQPGASAGTPGWRLDWISPTTADAPLAAAALPEAAERAARAGDTSAVAGRPSALRLQVTSGPAWNGYFGLQMSLQAARAGSNRAGLPAGSTAWLALVELLPAGTDGSPGARALVRSVAGPLPVDGLATTPSPNQAPSHLRALRWPEGARPERLQARAWIEAPTGQVLLMAADRCP
jgi:hypothetical protein